MTHIRQTLMRNDDLSKDTQQPPTSPFALLPLEHRARVARSVGSKYNPLDMDEHEFAIAKSIVAEALIDAAVMVRQALMEGLISNPLAPPEILKALTEDVDLIAVPIIEVCESLQADDIIDILKRSRTNLKMCAAARRCKLPEQISSFLCEYGDADVITDLFTNLSAEITSEAIAMALSRHGNAKNVQSALASRPSVPLIVIDRLLELIVVRVDHSVSAEDCSEGPVSEDPVDDATSLSSDNLLAAMLRPAQRALIGLSGAYTDFEVFVLIGHLEAEGRLPDLMILRSLCLGNLQFFAAAVAVKAKMPNSMVSSYVQTSDHAKLKRAIVSARLPANWTAFIFKAIQVVTNCQLDAAQLSTESYAALIQERITSIMESGELNLSADDIEVVLAP